MQEKLAQYKKSMEDQRKLEEGIEKLKAVRSNIAKELLFENGKEQLYDFGDGQKLFVSATKSGTSFLAPQRIGKKKAKKIIVGEKVVEVDGEGAMVAPSETAAPGAPAKRRGRPPKVKAAIDTSLMAFTEINSAPVETKAPPAEIAPAITEPIECINVPNPNQNTPELIEEFIELVPGGKNAEPTKDNEKTEPKKDLDPLEAALAELE